MRVACSDWNALLPSIPGSRYVARCQAVGFATVVPRHRKAKAQLQANSRNNGSCREGPTTTSAHWSRRQQLLHLGLGTYIASSLYCPLILPALGRSSSAKLSRSALQAFQDALSIDGSYEERRAAWDAVIQLAPDSSAAWSNRGVLHLQYGRWAEAEADLSRAVQLELTAAGAGQQDITSVMTSGPEAFDAVDASTLNNLGNAEVALGKLQLAQVHFQAASRDPGLRSIALANLALCAFEGGDEELAVRVARQVLRRDPGFLDMRAGLVAFLYGSDGLGGTLYSRGTAIARVRGRWPPRATAALAAFLDLSDTGTATGYDLQEHSYTFDAVV